MSTTTTTALSFWRDFVRTWAGRGDDLGYGDIATVSDGTPVQVVPVVRSFLECTWTKPDGQMRYVELYASLMQTDEGWLIRDTSSIKGADGQPLTDESTLARFAPGMLLGDEFGAGALFGGDIEIRDSINRFGQRSGTSVLIDGVPLSGSDAVLRAIRFKMIEANAGSGGIPAKVSAATCSHGVYVLIEQIPDAHLRAGNRDWTLVYADAGLSAPQVIGMAHYQMTCGLRGADTDVALASLQAAACIHDAIQRGYHVSPEGLAAALSTTGIREENGSAPALL